MGCIELKSDRERDKIKKTVALILSQFDYKMIIHFISA
jgi:hypothetical protein